MRTIQCFKIIARFFLLIASWIMALVILFEEWGWEPLTRLVGRLAHLPVFRQIEERISKLSPYPALLLFFAPAISLLPIKLLALHAIANGHSLIGLTVIITAKVVGTAIVARLFHLTQPALMQLNWFARWYAKWTSWKTRVVEYARASTVWRAAHNLKQRVRMRWQLIRLVYFPHE